MDPLLDYGFFYLDEVLILSNHLLNEVLILSNHLSVLVNDFLSAIDFFQ